VTASKQTFNIIEIEVHHWASTSKCLLVFSIVFSLIQGFLIHCFLCFLCSCGTFKVSFASPKKILMRSMHSLLDSNTHPWCT
jgi:hypothetical protein